MSEPGPQMHQRHQQPVDEDQLVLRPGPRLPFPGTVTPLMTPGFTPRFPARGELRGKLTQVLLR